MIYFLETSYMITLPALSRRATNRESSPPDKHLYWMILCLVKFCVRGQWGILCSPVVLSTTSNTQMPYVSLKTHKTIVMIRVRDSEIQWNARKHLLLPRSQTIGVRRWNTLVRAKFMWPYDLRGIWYSLIHICCWEDTYRNCVLLS